MTFGDPTGNGESKNNKFITAPLQGMPKLSAHLKVQ